ncbi:MAG: single-stranded DNA-binding protein [Verrucomicrobia bacterium]|nr:single-stranded DNA-binding protein [Verrucomicrobiota bacterium]
MNKITIAGHLGADPETRFTSTGKKVTTLRVATRTRKGAQDDTIWWRVTVWGDQFEKMIPHFKKGSPIIVYGEIHKPEIFNDREGKPQVSMEITAVDIQFSPFGKPDGQRQGEGASAAHHAPTGPAAPFGMPQEGAANPYMGYSQAKSEPYAKAASGPQGQTYDDEVPF